MAEATCQVDYDPNSGKMTVRGLYGQSVEDSAACMGATIEKMIEVKQIPRLIAVAEAREYEYSFEETKLLYQIAEVIMKVRSQEIASLHNVLIHPACDNILPGKYGWLQRVLLQMRYDPVGAHKALQHEIRHYKVKIKRLNEGAYIPELNTGMTVKNCLDCFTYYINNSLQPIFEMLEGTKLIQMSTALNLKERDLYRRIFHPIHRPTFMYTRFAITPPRNAEPIERYKVGDAEVEIFKLPNKTRKLYNLVPPEFRLRDEEYTILDQARRYLGRHEPTTEEIGEPRRFRENIFNISLDLIRDIVRGMQLQMPDTQTKKLANVLTRYTAGLGVLEVFLADENVQDLLINSPLGQAPVFLMHGKHLECETNIWPSPEDGESWATRFRLQSGRPLDEANPVLDTELIVPGGRARVAAITRPISPEGLGFAFRRFRDKPWTFPLFVNVKMFDSFAAGLIWFIIDGARTMLVAGTRGSGKTSFLGSIMTQLMPKIRTITIEDTLELPVTQLREIGYNIERLKARSVITKVETELPAEEVLRTSLRLGDSAVILGEVRSTEALALYEAMRIGALANIVAGTIHGESAYGVFDRVVNDLGVPPTSFKATDIILIASSLRSPDMLEVYRRLTEITEVRKNWKEDPELEGGFVKLMEYRAKEDKMVPTKTLLMGESFVLNEIANRVKEWKANWPAVWENIVLRSRVIQAVVDAGAAKPELMEAPFVKSAISQFHTIGFGVKEEVGALDSKMISERWTSWLKQQISA